VLPLECTYAGLPGDLYRPLEPAARWSTRQLWLNHTLAGELGLDPGQLASPAGLQILAGAKAPSGAQPIAQAYAGHQFGHLALLGDGRALLLGELVTPGRQRVDIQLKGSGQTPYSRRGDGLAALGPMLREYLISGAMHALGVPTTRSLAVVATNEIVYRDRPASGAVLTRVASSHIRVGTFQFAAMQGDTVLQALVDYTIQRHDPDLQGTRNPTLGLLNRVIERQARLIAQWMLLGFVHGVMNTDNVSIAGETIDYGPCAFMDTYDPATVFSSIDRQGRYAYGNQPAIGHWNLCRFAESLLPLLDTNQDKALELAQVAIDSYAHQYDTAWRTGLANKLGFESPSAAVNQVAEDFLQMLQITGADYTNSFRALMRQDLNQDAFAPWLQRWLGLIEQQPGGLPAALKRMALVNPVIIPRNHLVQAALDAAEEGDDQPFELLNRVLQTPFDPAHEGTIYDKPPPAGTTPYVTYCGT
jgi:uncharacterized protein YdiU (UPF0061 family)